MRTIENNHEYLKMIRINFNFIESWNSFPGEHIPLPHYRQRSQEKVGFIRSPLGGPMTSTAHSMDVTEMGSSCSVPYCFKARCCKRKRKKIYILLDVFLRAVCKKIVIKEHGTLLNNSVVIFTPNFKPNLERYQVDVFRKQVG